MSRSRIIVLICVIINYQLVVDGFGQDIPIGAWRSHVSYSSIHAISIAGSKVYAATNNGFLIFDGAENSLSTITKLDGLSSTDITQVAVDQLRQQVVIGYADGNLDILRSNEIINFDRLKTSTTIVGSKKINHINVNGNFAYLSTDYGVVVFDLVRLEVKETFRDLGPAGNKIKIYQSTFLSDSIFLATEKGALAGDLDDNLLDFNNWRRFTSGAFMGEIQSITTFNSNVYSAINNAGIYRYENGSWTQQIFLAGLVYKNLTTGNNLVITEGNNVWKLSSADVLSQVISVKITNPTIALEDTGGKVWIGDQRNGLVSDKTGTFESYFPNGPSFSGGLRLKYNSVSSVMYGVSGGYSPSLLPLGKSEFANSFFIGDWRMEETLLDKDITDVEFSGNRLFLSSYGYGLEVTEGGVSTRYDETNSPLTSVSPGNNVNVTSLAYSSNGVWVANSGTAQSLHLFKSDSTWESFSFPSIVAARYPIDLAIDYLGHVWMTLNPGNGGGILVFDREANQSVYLTDVQGAGGLPSRLVYSVALDNNGQVWVGTAVGAAYFPDPSRVFSQGINAVKPIFENRFLLRDEKVTAIEVDGGNRKWMGTENGVWLFNPSAEEQLYYFSEENSPLLSNKIVDIEIDSRIGEVFFMTDRGIDSYRSDATASEAIFKSVKIFPNPVTASFNGFVGISGLATNATVKITDVSGKLVWQTLANGGTATWNVRDYNGRRASTGVYLVFSTTQDGSESVVGKIAVVD